MRRQRDLLENLSFWQLQCAGWAFYTVFPVGAWMLGGLPSSAWLWLAFTRGLSGFVVTSALRPLCRRLFKARIHYAALFPLLVVAAVVLGILEFEVMRRLGTLIGLTSKGLNGSGTELGFLLLRSSVLLLWLVMYFSIKSLQQFVESEREFQEAEGRLLRSQMNPHFLFNALTTIMAVRKDEQKVATITQSLADYLRFSLQQEQGEEHGLITHALGDELRALEDYLRVEKARFGDDLVWRIDADEEACRTAVPSALVQPLLENAIKYGQQTGPRPLTISITAQVVQDNLRVDVQNSGRWVESNSNRTRRIGLSNLKRRLELLYGNKASLDTRHTPAMVKVCLSLPTTAPR
jgi:Histidine kinase